MSSAHEDVLTPAHMGKRTCATRKQSRTKEKTAADGHGLFVQRTLSL